MLCFGCVSFSIDDVSINYLVVGHDIFGDGLVMYRNDVIFERPLFVHWEGR